MKIRSFIQLFVIFSVTIMSATVSAQSTFSICREKKLECKNVIDEGGTFNAMFGQEYFSVFRGSDTFMTTSLRRQMRRECRQMTRACRRYHRRLSNINPYLYSNEAQQISLESEEIRDNSRNSSDELIEAGPSEDSREPTTVVQR